MSRAPTLGREQGGRGRDRGRGWGPSVWERGKHIWTRPGRACGGWRSWTPHPSLLLPPTQMIRSGRKPRTLHAHPGLAWQSLPPCCPYTLFRHSQGKEKGGGGRKNSEEQRQREKMDETMGALAIRKSAGWAGGTKVLRLGRMGRGHCLALSHTLAQKCIHASGTVWDAS